MSEYEPLLRLVHIENSGGRESVFVFKPPTPESATNPTPTTNNPAARVQQGESPPALRPPHILDPHRPGLLTPDRVGSTYHNTSDDTGSAAQVRRTDTAAQSEIFLRIHRAALEAAGVSIEPTAVTPSFYPEHHAGHEGPQAELSEEHAPEASRAARSLSGAAPEADAAEVANEPTETLQPTPTRLHSASQDELARTALQPPKDYGDTRRGELRRARRWRRRRRLWGAVLAGAAATMGLSVAHSLEAPKMTQQQATITLPGKTATLSETIHVPMALASTEISADAVGAIRKFAGNVALLAAVGDGTIPTPITAASTEITMINVVTSDHGDISDAPLTNPAICKPNTNAIVDLPNICGDQSSSLEIARKELAAARGKAVNPILMQALASSDVNPNNYIHTSTKTRVVALTAPEVAKLQQAAKQAGDKNASSAIHAVDHGGGQQLPPWAKAKIKDYTSQRGVDIVAKVTVIGAVRHITLTHSEHNHGSTPLSGATPTTLPRGMAGLVPRQRHLQAARPATI